MNLRIIHTQWTVKRNPTIKVSQPRKDMCSLPIGRMCSLRALQPPSFSIQSPASSDMTAKVESTTDWMMSGWPTRAQSAAIADEIVRKLIILPQLTSLCLNKERPIWSTMTGAATGGTLREMLQNVRGWRRSSSTDIRLIITIVWRNDGLGRTSIKMETFLVDSPSRFSFSLINCAHRHWIWSETSSDTQGRFRKKFLSPFWWLQDFGSVEFCADFDAYMNIINSWIFLSQAYFWAIWSVYLQVIYDILRHHKHQ